MGADKKKAVTSFTDGTLNGGKCDLASPTRGKAMFDYDRHAELMREIRAFHRRPENWRKPLNRIRGAEAKMLRARLKAMDAEMECYPRGTLDVARIMAACEGPPTLELSGTASAPLVPAARGNLALLG
jgi:hypothetical protein